MTHNKCQPGSRELLSWADEAQAYIDGGDVPLNEMRKANATVAALRLAAGATNALTLATPAAEGREALANDEAILHQFINDGADRNRARQALKRLMAYNRSPVEARGDREALIEQCAGIAEAQCGYVSCEPMFERGYRKAREDAGKEIRAALQPSSGSGK